MKLKNKKTGEIKAFDEVMREVYKWNNYNSLTELNEEWEDVPEEPKEYYYIDDAGVIQIDQVLCPVINMRKSIGNYFDTEEKAEKAVEKLKATKRLKDKGVSFEVKVIGRKWYLEPKAKPSQRTFDETHDIYKDLLIVFGVK